jgi:hypothetical protein
MASELGKKFHDHGRRSVNLFDRRSKIETGLWPYDLVLREYATDLVTRRQNFTNARAYLHVQLTLGQPRDVRRILLLLALPADCTQNLQRGTVLRVLRKHELEDPYLAGCAYRAHIPTALDADPLEKGRYWQTL